MVRLTITEMSKIVNKHSYIGIIQNTCKDGSTRYIVLKHVESMVINADDTLSINMTSGKEIRVSKTDADKVHKLLQDIEALNVGNS